MGLFFGGDDMPAKEMIYAYIKQLPNSDDFIQLDDTKQEQYVFSASENIKGYFNSSAIELTPRIIAIQALYQFEGDNEEYSKLKAHGVSNASVKDTSVSFEYFGLIHPTVKQEVEDLYPELKRTVGVGRLI